jgi:sugar phosphate isomerase/epimerase
MKLPLGIVADEICRDFAEAVRIGTRAGLGRFEVRSLPSGRIPTCSPADLQSVDDAIARESIVITGISPGLFKYTSDAATFEHEMSEVYPRSVDLAKHWGLSEIIVFGFHKNGATESNAASFPSDSPPPEILEWLAAADEQAVADGLRLVIEPEPICWADTGRAAANLIVRSGAKNVRINYDPGNVAWLQNRDPLDEFEAVLPWLAHVHVKDLRPLSQGAGKPEWVPAGEGMIDYRKFFRSLQSAHYDGPISIEPHMDGSEETIRRCAEAVEHLW